MLVLPVLLRLTSITKGCPWKISSFILVTFFVLFHVLRAYVCVCVFFSMCCLFVCCFTALCCRRVPLRHSHPNMVHRIPSSGAVVDMDMSTPLMYEALTALGCDYHPLLVVEERSPCERLFFFLFYDCTSCGTQRGCLCVWLFFNKSRATV